MPRLATIKQPESLAKMAYEAIRQSILSGHWKIGELYNEKSIAEDLGISRTPAREALLELASQELILFMPRRGVMLNRFTHRDVDEIFELRKFIELASVEKISNISPQLDLITIEESLIAQRKAIKQGDYLSFIEADRLFHISFSLLTSNSRIISIMENIRDMIHVMGVKALSLEGRALKVIEEHTAIFKTVRDGNVQEARHAMAYHLDQSMEAVKESEMYL